MFSYSLWDTEQVLLTSVPESMSERAISKLPIHENRIEKLLLVRFFIAAFLLADSRKYTHFWATLQYLSL